MYLEYIELVFEKSVQKYAQNIGLHIITSYKCL